jgi:hypothetical protein
MPAKKYVFCSHDSTQDKEVMPRWGIRWPGRYSTRREIVCVKKWHPYEKYGRQFACILNDYHDSGEYPTHGFEKTQVQGDQIGRIFANFAIAYFAQYFKNYLLK